MSNETSDKTLMARLLYHISLGAAAGADALLRSGLPDTTALIQWLTDTATGLAQVSVDDNVLAGIQLQVEDRSAILEFLNYGRVSR